MVCFRNSLLLAAFLSAPLSAQASSLSADGLILQRASQAPVLIGACSRIAEPLFTAKSGATEPAKENLAVLSTFVLRGSNREARIRCGRLLASVGQSPKNPYGVAANAIVLAMFESGDPVIRRGAVHDLLGTTYAQNARALLRHALHDPSPAVAATSFENLSWPMKADIGVSHDRAMYEGAISQGLKSRNDRVVGGALAAYASLHQSNDQTLRPYALDKRAPVRLGALNAYNFLTTVTQGMARFVETRLNDPDVQVREAAMLQLFRWGDHHALPQMEQLAKTAATSQERATAREYARALKTQPGLFP